MSVLSLTGRAVAQLLGLGFGFAGLAMIFFLALRNGAFWRRQSEDEVEGLKKGEFFYIN